MGVLDIKRQRRRKVAAEKVFDQKAESHLVTTSPRPSEGNQVDAPAESAEVNFTDDEQWFLDNKDTIPNEPFQLCQGIWVADPPKMYRWLESDVRDPRSARRLFGALSGDLEKIRCLYSC